MTTLNCEKGESFGLYRMGDDAHLMPLIDAEDMTLNHIEPHGSLYGMGARDEEIAHAACDAADVFKAPLRGRIVKFEVENEEPAMAGQVLVELA